MIDNNFQIQNLLSKKELDLIHNSTVDLLENQGVEIDNDKALSVFKQNGIEVEDKKVYLSEQKLEELIAQIPSNFELKARNQNNNLEIGNNKSILGPPLGPPFIYKKEDKEYGTYDDYNQLMKYFHLNQYIDLVGGDIIATTDLDEKIRHKKMFYSAVKYSDKVLIGTGSGNSETKEILEMAKTLFGENEFNKNNYVLKLVGASSPLEYNNTALNTLINWAKAGQPLSVYAQTMSGMTGPNSLAGILTLQNAEILLGASLVQLINPKTPVIYSSTSSVTDMKSGEITVGNSQYTKIIAAVAEIADYYNMPSLIAGGMTDSKLTDNQAGYETMLNMHTAVGSGVDIIIYAAGSIADYMGVSYEKVIQDTNILKNIENYQNGIVVNEDSIAQDIVKEVGCGGNFMTHPHTMESLEKRLGKKISTENNIISKYQQPKLDNNLDKRLKNLSDN